MLPSFWGRYEVEGNQLPLTFGSGYQRRLSRCCVIQPDESRSKKLNSGANWEPTEILDASQMPTTVSEISLNSLQEEDPAAPSTVKSLAAHGSPRLPSRSAAVAPWDLEEDEDKW